ncbi:MAG: four helix bundle protein [Candidatus Staskawiczbacteria bacterium RIFCSPHIGHO2_02_FULL_34_10]|uniref:Four helix bundle protein n=1 Tax=Candidatus Staskawiczbacteria bacterium RIFCSPHIGHO2_02_FULL_34_10 TaxID=1802205 RepID=A0A1G2HY84_9BACT|nr:MAG: four helix bundle protein [Candidatus Staskawiczbacteria bacterium RIFCSPHIGHO2_02_FULL_34_10]
MDKKYDLEERTGSFGKSIINFCKYIKQDVITKPLISQLIRSGTSIGANYMEANGASSRKDFKNKIHICKKESQETMHWLKMIIEYEPNKKEQAMILCKEAQELTFIFGKIISSMNSKNSAF